MKRFIKVIVLLVLLLITITANAEPKFLPCNISDDQLKFEISSVFSLAISEMQKEKGPILKSEEIIKFSKDFAKELERNDKCQNEIQETFVG